MGYYLGSLQRYLEMGEGDASGCFDLGISRLQSCHQPPASRPSPQCQAFSCHESVWMEHNDRARERQD